MGPLTAMPAQQQTESSFWRGSTENPQQVGCSREITLQVGSPYGGEPS